MGIHHGLIIPWWRSFFESLLRLGVGFRVLRTHRESAKAQPYQLLAHSPLMHLDTETRLDLALQVNAASAMPQVSAAALRSEPSNTKAIASIRLAAFASLVCADAARRSSADMSFRVISTAINPSTI